MNKIKNKNNGITLIALIITIIVMLILVAVTITMAVNGGLFEYASSAGTKMNQAIANEQELANLEANMTVDELIDKYTKTEEDDVKTITFYLAGHAFTVEEGMTWRSFYELTELYSGLFRLEIRSYASEETMHVDETDFDEEGDNGYVTFDGGDEEENFQHPDDVITAGRRYYGY